jgi:branched-subunit amino acid transport protein
METLLIFAGMALATFFTRFTMIALLGRETPPLLRRWLRHVPVAVLAALVAPAALAPQGALRLGPHALAAAVGALAAWRTRNVPVTIAAGMAAFWVLRAVLG